MVGGMISSTVLTLVVIPAVYALWREAELRRDLTTEAGADRPIRPVLRPTA